MAHHNPEVETELRVDASPVGLNAILMQFNGQETLPSHMRRKPYQC